MRVQPKPMKAARRAAKLSKEPEPEPTKTLEPTKKAKKTKNAKHKRPKHS